MLTLSSSCGNQPFKAAKVGGRKGGAALASGRILWEAGKPQPRRQSKRGQDKASPPMQGKAEDESSRSPGLSSATIFSPRELAEGLPRGSGSSGDSSSASSTAALMRASPDCVTALAERLEGSSRRILSASRSDTADFPATDSRVFGCAFMPEAVSGAAASLKDCFIR